MNASISKVGIIGLGYIGLPLALAMQEAGLDVVGVDIDRDKTGQLVDGNSTVEDVTDDELQVALEKGLEISAAYDPLASADVVSICVPTPLSKSGQPDLSFVIGATESLRAVLTEGTTVILESTVYPGATEDIVGTRLREEGWTIGDDVFLAFSPERIDPGNSRYGPRDIPKVIGGVTPMCAERALSVYDRVFDTVVQVDSTAEAEVVKLLENTFRAVNIGLVNELAQVAHALDVDIWSVIDAAATKPFGFMPFQPGPGLGGHCIPIDPFYLSWKANELGIETRFIDLADSVNREMPSHILSRVAQMLNADGVALADATVSIIGVAYKPDVSDVREAAAIDIIRQLEQWEAHVCYHDPHVPTLAVGDRTYESVSLAAAVDGVDCAIIVTDHTAIDIEAVVEGASRVFDTRNATADYDAAHVLKL
jgi:UDP-N-acetyl-D-glucosamine dehydrogenase